MDDFEKYLDERLEKDKEFKKIWEEEAFKREILKMLVEMRIKEGLTQKQLAERLSTTRSYISQIESGKGNPNLNFLVKLGRALNKKLEIHYV